MGVHINLLTYLKPSPPSPSPPPPPILKNVRQQKKPQMLLQFNSNQEIHIILDMHAKLKQPQLWMHSGVIRGILYYAVTFDCYVFNTNWNSPVIFSALFIYIFVLVQSAHSWKYTHRHTLHFFSARAWVSTGVSHVLPMRMRVSSGVSVFLPSHQSMSVASLNCPN